jgi:hypothetical protein
MKMLHCALLVSTVSLHAADPAILTTEFVYDTGPHSSIHATTIVETPTGLVTAWFGGTAGKKSRRLHLGLASASRWQMDRRRRNGQRRATRRPPTSNMESGAVSAEGRAADALLQRRSVTKHLVGRDQNEHRWRQIMVRDAKAAQRHLRPDQEQARAARQ